MRNIHDLLITCFIVTGIGLPSHAVTQGGGRGGSGPTVPPSASAPRMELHSSPGHGPVAPAISGVDARLFEGVRNANTPSFSNRVRPLLPPDTDLIRASAGFRNESDFLAALQASHSLGIPSNDVKSKMTEGGDLSLDKAIQSLRPEMGKDEVKQSVEDAEQKARDDIRAASDNPNRMNTPREIEVAEAMRMTRGLNERVPALLHAGMRLKQGSAGFRNICQFLSALHISRNLGIPFPELRARMIAGGEGLGEAIRMLRPAMTHEDVEVSAQSALMAAEHDLTGLPPGSSPTGTHDQNR